MRPDRLFLVELLDSADIIARRVAQADAQQFLSDDLLQDAILRRLIVIGEAAARVSAELRVRYPAVPWRDVADFRNIAVHGYFALDWQLVWDAATVNAPMLRAQIAAILAAEFPEEDA